MRVVITGHAGQLGRQLQASFGEHEVYGVDLPEYDITDPAISAAIAGWRPDLIVHSAAYTNVDGCEQEPDKAFRINTLGTQNVAVAAQRCNAALMYVSTNEVFDGRQREPYREWDTTGAVSVYARSKAAAEQVVRALAPRFYIVRIAWLFGPGGSNFVTKILEGAQKHGAIRVAADEFGNPTYAPDLARAMARLALTGHCGIYHLTNSGFCSRYEFAREILRLGGFGHVPVSPILQSDWPRPSQPPLHSILANSAGAMLGITLRPWQDALAEYVALLDPK